MYLTFGFLYTSVTTNICTFLILALCRQNCTFFKNDRKHSHFVHLGYCHYVTKYLISDMMNYNYLRVLRNRVRRIGKHSPGFSVFRTRVRFCPDADRAVCRVPIQSTIQLVSVMPDRLSTSSEDSVLQMESNNANLIELLRQFSPSGYIIPCRNKDL